MGYDAVNTDQQNPNVYAAFVTQITVHSCNNKLIKQ